METEFRSQVLNTDIFTLEPSCWPFCFESLSVAFVVLQMTSDFWFSGLPLLSAEVTDLPHLAILCSVGDKTQGMLGKQELCQLSYILNIKRCNPTWS